MTEVNREQLESLSQQLSFEAELDRSMLLKRGGYDRSVEVGLNRLRLVDEDFHYLMGLSRGVLLATEENVAITLPSGRIIEITLSSDTGEPKLVFERFGKIFYDPSLFERPSDVSGGHEIRP